MHSGRKCRGNEERGNPRMRRSSTAFRPRFTPLEGRNLDITKRATTSLTVTENFAAYAAFAGHCWWRCVRDEMVHRRCGSSRNPAAAFQSQCVAWSSVTTALSSVMHNGIEMVKGRLVRLCVFDVLDPGALGRPLLAVEVRRAFRRPFVVFLTSYF